MGLSLGSESGDRILQALFYGVFGMGWYALWWGCGGKANLSKNRHWVCSMSEAPRKGNALDK